MQPELGGRQILSGGNLSVELSNGGCHVSGFCNLIPSRLCAAVY